MHYPKIKSQFSVIFHDADHIEIRDCCLESRSHYFNDDHKTGLLSKVFAMLDGNSSITNIANVTGASAEQIASLLDELVDLDLLIDGAESLLDYYTSLYNDTLNRYPLENKAAKDIVLFGDNEITKAVSYILQDEIAAGVLNSSEAPKALMDKLSSLTENDFFDGFAIEKTCSFFSELSNKYVLYAQDRMNPVRAHYFNIICNKLKISWLPVSIDGPYLFIGPTITPQGAPCYDCFEERALMNLKYKEHYLKYKKAIATGTVLLPNMPLHRVISHIAASYAAQEILNFALLGTTFTTRKVLSIYIPTMEFKYNEVQPLANCKTCGSVHHRDNQQLYFDVQALLHDELK